MVVHRSGAMSFGVQTQSSATEQLKAGASLAAWLLVAASTAGCQDPPPPTTEGAATASASVAEPSASATGSAQLAAPSVTPSAHSAKGALRPAEPCLDLVKSTVEEQQKELGLRPGNHAHGVHVSTLAPWKTIRARGFVYAFAAAAYGATANRDFLANWQMMKRCGLPRGAYHFVVPGKDGGYQASVFLKALGSDVGELPPIIDLERPVECKSSCCDVSCAQWIAVTESWIRTVEQATGRVPLIYTVEPFWNECMCGTRRFAKHALWLGAWPKFDFPKRLAFGGWPQWAFYHYLGNRRFAGGVIDIDMFAGDEAAFRRFVESSAKR